MQNGSSVKVKVNLSLYML